MFYASPAPKYRKELHGHRRNNDYDDETVDEEDGRRELLMELIPEVLRLRLCVGYLGEKDQHGWWSSTFLGPISEGFLKPVFPRTFQLARYNGVLEAARLAHDERIGVGRVVHLFRLPERFEFRIQETARDEPTLAGLIAELSEESAMNALREIGKGQPPRDAIGPTRIDSNKDLDNDGWISAAAAHYLNAFEEGRKIFPYVSTAEEPVPES